MTNPCKMRASADGLAGRVGRAPKRVRKDGRLSTHNGARTERKANTDELAARIAVRWLPVDALTPDPKNARVHSRRQIARIADSIAAFGFNVPVLVDAKGGVLAGHGRLLAARRLGLGYVPTITLDHLDGAERRAFMIADNRLGELASWDEGRLAIELDGLKSLDLDFSIEATGFEMKEIDLRIEAVDAAAGRVSRAQRARLLGPAVAALNERGGAVDDRALQRGGGAVTPGSEPGGRAHQRRRQPAVARASDAWALGPHWILCGDVPGAEAYSVLDAAIRRWQAVTGEAASLHPGGETFDAVARSRRKSLSRRETGEGAEAGRELP